MVVELLIPRLLAAGEEEGGLPSASFLNCLRAAFQDLAGGSKKRVPLLARQLRPQVPSSLNIILLEKKKKKKDALK